MMRAFAVLSAAAVVVFALPTTAGAAANADLLDATVGSTSAGTAAAAPVNSFLSSTTALGLSVGAVLWLSIALVAAVLAFVALNRSRVRGASAEPLSVQTVRSLPSAAGRTDFSADIAAATR